MSNDLVHFDAIEKINPTGVMWIRGNRLRFSAILLKCGVQYIATYDDKGKAVYFAYPDKQTFEAIKDYPLERGLRVTDLTPTND